jgi:hypothetical protein
MKNLLLRLLLAGSLAVAALAPAAAFAQDHGDEEPAEEHAEGEGTTEEHSESSSSFIGGPEWTDARSMALWSLIGVTIFGGALGVLYLFKRKVGAFPQNPTWVAPISVMLASDLPGDDGDPHGAEHDAHGSHAPAH